MLKSEQKLVLENHKDLTKTNVENNLRILINKSSNKRDNKSSPKTQSRPLSPPTQHSTSISTQLSRQLSRQLSKPNKIVITGNDLKLDHINEYDTTINLDDPSNVSKAEPPSFNASIVTMMHRLSFSKDIYTKPAYPKTPNKISARNLDINDDISSLLNTDLSSTVDPSMEGNSPNMDSRKMTRNITDINDNDTPL